MPIFLFTKQKAAQKRHHANATGEAGDNVVEAHLQA
jgi:hypothetical protein